MESKREFLRTVLRILNQYKIRYWLDFGTLLGCVRDKDIIPWDLDCDLSINIVDYDTVLAILRKHQEPPIQEIQDQNKKRIYILPNFANFHMDIYSWYIGDTICRSTDPEFGIQGFGRDEVQDLDIVEFLGMPVYIPQNPHLRLTRLYGNYQNAVQKSPYWDGENIASYNIRHTIHKRLRHVRD